MFHVKGLESSVSLRYEETYKNFETFLCMIVPTKIFSKNGSKFLPISFEEYMRSGKYQTQNKLIGHIAFLLKLP